MRLRPMTAADFVAVLALNSAAEGLVQPLGPDRLDWLRLIAAHAVVVDVDDRPAGFVLTFTPGSAYDGLEFGWFTQTYADRFLYIERIVVDPEHRRQGIASTVYNAIERAAKPFDRAVARVRSDSLDSAGLTFHTSRGYHEVANQRLANGTSTALLSKEL
ncbi:putative GNAT superfamily acetyltransferase [Kribbella aluminosa]|uniref:GNAT superfamily acetyltransferase n=1 Tax=Kribbella aluminosa TaxID=416017 RepID=A0ABS4UPA2_9ACTN|nr:GNAT family N-acetyltransferase [Kribbella aluminosa]MBP2353473.1 putative GNAT superfamily acetyltransferase [Kribbella aluminosa]